MATSVICKALEMTADDNGIKMEDIPSYLAMKFLAPKQTLKISSSHLFLACLRPVGAHIILFAGLVVGHQGLPLSDCFLLVKRSTCRG